MHEDTPSVTAIVVASARALSSMTHASTCDARDRVGLELLPKPVQSALLGLERAAEHAPWLAWLARGVGVASFGLIDHLALRTRAIDAALEGALARGVEQLVILGAGLDARAHRLDALARATVFEVDHPSSQLHKRRRTGTLALRAAHLSYVAVDFARDALSDKLEEHGHDAKRPTFWIWEGVVPYLDRAAIRATLQAVAKRSARSSQLAATYVTPDMVWLRRAPLVISASMRALGEPVRSQIEPAEWSRILVEAGLEPIEDTGTRDWRERFGERRQLGVRIDYERLSLSERR